MNGRKESGMNDLIDLPSAIKKSVSECVGANNRRLALLILLGSRTASRIVFVEHFGRNALEHLTWEDAQQLPADVERLEDGAILVVAFKWAGYGRGKDAASTNLVR